MVTTFVSLRYRNYRLIWTSMLFSSSGQWMEQVALSWLVWTLTEDPFMLGAINGTRSLPFFLSPLAGVAADRIDRKKLMITTQFGVMILSFSMSLLVYSGLIRLWMVFIFAILAGTTWAFNQPVRQAIIPNLVPKKHIMNAVALGSSAMNMTRLIGPIGAGFIIAFVGVEGAFASKGLAYIAVILMTLFVKVPPIGEAANRLGIRQDLWSGFHYIWTNRMIFTLLVMALIPIVLVMPYIWSFMPVFADQVYDMGPEGMGILYGAVGLGALGGSLTVASLGNFRQKGLLLMLSGIVMGAMLILFGMSTYFPLTLIVLVGVGFPQTFYNSLTQTLIQMNITDDVRGRVMSILMLDRGLGPLGSFFAGLMASIVGAPGAVIIGGSLTLILAIFGFIFMPNIRKWDYNIPMVEVSKSS